MNDVERQIVGFIKSNGTVSTKETAKYIGLSITQTKEYLYRLVKANLVESFGGNRNKTYRLK
ncbi:FaeA/PapI family transcriptional regulator [uncultured Fibrobacter sp.]|uniref:FaeA/PapI family transcriptional regulator n=1 Tax=uncultured Fibrobacter sp. TaxID=261512 RepID=UPI00345C2D26